MYLTLSFLFQPLSPPAGPSYVVSSTCPSAASAPVTCKAPVCGNPGQVVQLAGLCISTLAGATVVTTVDGKPATNVTCPDFCSNCSISLQGIVTGYLGTCDYASDAVPVTSESVQGACVVCGLAACAPHVCWWLEAGRLNTRDVRALGRMCSCSH